jgi:hypothetical protein
MYYDRRLTDHLLATLLPAGPLHWLVEQHRTLHDLAHVEFRRNRGDGKHGSVEVYVGRTAVLKCKARSDGRFSLDADDYYKD